jgi:hypothetical protein
VTDPGSTTGAVFRETTAEPRTQSVPLAQVSLELGHLYMEDFEAGPERLREHFARVRPWADAVRTAAATRGRQARVSTCFLIDDYFTRFSSPAELVPTLLAEAGRAGLTIDYLARESGCGVADGIDGSRPPAREYEKYPFHLSAHVRSLAVEIDVPADGGLTHRYSVEAFVRHEALTVVSRKVADEANVFVEVYPQFDGEFSEYYGAGFVRTWDRTNIVTKVILSRFPLVTSAEGTVAAADFAELDRIWESGFKRVNEVLPDCT